MHEKFIARQPIFDKRLRVYAYELLFRGGPQNFFQPRNHAASSVIADSLTLFDLQTLTGHARAFINVDELALRLGAPRLLPADRIVVEILESVKPTDEIVGICRELRQDGYSLALDDFLGEPALQPLVDLAHYLKVDFTLLDADGRKRVAEEYLGNGLSLLAEKVETQNDLDEARNLGYCYFQGYFFCRPSMLETRDIPGNKLIQLQLLRIFRATSSFSFSSLALLRLPNSTTTPSKICSSRSLPCSIGCFATSTRRRLGCAARSIASVTRSLCLVKTNFAAGSPSLPSLQ